MYSAITTVKSRKPTKLYWSYNNIIKATDSYMFRASLAPQKGKQ